MSEQAVISAEATVNKGENARMASFVGALAIADLVKTTLGPKGMDKILQQQSTGIVTITNDGATILKNIHIDNAAAKVLVDISKTQDDEVGDGTTSVVVLAGELLRQAETLLAQRVHPMTIIEGWRMATDIARKALIESAVDKQANKEEMRQALIQVAETTLSSKILSADKHKFSRLAVDAVMRLDGSTDLDLIQIIKKPGSTLSASYLEEGFLLDKKIGVGQPKRIENATILIANTPMDTDKVKLCGSRVKVSSMDQVAEIEAAEKKKMADKCKKIIDHGITCFINRQLIYNYPESIFTDAGICSIEHADFDGVERLAAVLGGEICSLFRPDTGGFLELFLRCGRLGSKIFNLRRQLLDCSSLLFDGGFELCDLRFSRFNLILKVLGLVFAPFGIFCILGVGDFALFDDLRLQLAKHL